MAGGGGGEEGRAAGPGAREKSGVAVTWWERPIRPKRRIATSICSVLLPRSPGTFLGRELGAYVGSGDRVGGLGHLSLARSGPRFVRY
jgi:hypothetical protein